MICRLLSFLLAITFTNSTYAQYQLKGKVIDSLTNLPIDYASIGLYRNQDARLMDGKSSNAKSWTQRCPHQNSQNLHLWNRRTHL